MGQNRPKVAKSGHHPSPINSGVSILNRFWIDFQVYGAQTGLISASFGSRLSARAQGMVSKGAKRCQKVSSHCPDLDNGPISCRFWTEFWTDFGPKIPAHAPQRGLKKCQKAVTSIKPASCERPYQIRFFPFSAIPRRPGRLLAIRVSAHEGLRAPWLECRCPRRPRRPHRQRELDASLVV
jgi:hypothetical protein